MWRRGHLSVVVCGRLLSRHPPLRTIVASKDKQWFHRVWSTMCLIPQRLRIVSPGVAGQSKVRVREVEMHLTRADVFLHREGQFICVQPPCCKRLEPVLRTSLAQGRFDQRGMLQIKRQQRTLFEVESVGGYNRLRAFA